MGSPEVLYNRLYGDRAKPVGERSAVTAPNPKRNAATDSGDRQSALMQSTAAAANPYWRQGHKNSPQARVGGVRELEPE